MPCLGGFFRFFYSGKIQHIKTFLPITSTSRKHIGLHIAKKKDYLFSSQDFSPKVLDQLASFFSVSIDMEEGDTHAIDIPPG
jgi:hypothetical protein